MKTIGRFDTSLMCLMFLYGEGKQWSPAVTASSDVLSTTGPQSDLSSHLCESNLALCDADGGEFKGTPDIWQEGASSFVSGPELIVSDWAPFDKGCASAEKDKIVDSAVLEIAEDTRGGDDGM